MTAYGATFLYDKLAENKKWVKLSGDLQDIMKKFR